MRSITDGTDVGLLALFIEPQGPFLNVRKVTIMDVIGFNLSHASLMDTHRHNEKQFIIVPTAVAMCTTRRLFTARVHC